MEGVYNSVQKSKGSDRAVTESNEEDAIVSSLRVLGVSAIISAHYHDLQTFDPTFIVSNSIVPEELSCTHFRRLPRRVEIHFGHVELRMSERELWIQVFPEIPWDRVMASNLGHLITNCAQRFLSSAPHLAAPDIGFHWELALDVPNPEQWVQERFGPYLPPRVYDISDISASFVAVKGDLQVRVDVEVGGSEGWDSAGARWVALECFGSSRLDLSRSELMSETERWTVYAKAVREVLMALLEEEKENGTA